MDFGDATPSASDTTDASGNARVTHAFVSTGTYTVTANAASGPASGIATTQADVSRASVDTSISSSANPSSPGQAVTFTVGVSAFAPATGTPTGRVTFYDGSTLLGLQTLSGGTASLITSPLTAGSHTINYTYSGDSNFTGSTGVPLTQVVATDQSSTNALSVSLSSSANPFAVGDTVTFVAIVMDFARAPVAGAAVAFSSDGNQVSLTTASDGTATLQTAALPAGTSLVVATASKASYTVGTASLVQQVGATNAAADQVSDATASFVRQRNSLLAGEITTPSIDDRATTGAHVNDADGLPVLDFVASSLGPAADAISSVTNRDGGATQQPNFWIDGHFRLHGTGIESGIFGLGGAGADYLVNKNLLIGAEAYLDYMTSRTATTSLVGTGVLAGPYASTRLADGLTFDASLLYGGSWNTVTTRLLGDTFSGQFGTTRWLANGRLQGTMTEDRFRVMPEATFFLSEEASGAYTVKNGTGATVDIPATSVFDLKLGTGLTVATDAVLSGMMATPSARLQIGVEPTSGAAAAGLYGGIFAALSLAVNDWTLAGRLDAGTSTTGLSSVGLNGSLKGHF